jgi:uncharacterized membrane protein
MGRVGGASSASNTGSLVGLTFIVFLVLKLTGVIDWSWWWVTSPLWLAVLAVVAALVLVGVVGYGIYRIVKHVHKKRSAQANV